MIKDSGLKRVLILIAPYYFRFFHHVQCITAQIELGDLENGISCNPEYSRSLLSQRSEGGVQGVSPWENKEFKERGFIRSSFKN
jgi:hypothetical protein